MKCSFCENPQYISYSDGGAVKHVCKIHYKVRLIADIEMDDPVKKSCELCRSGILNFNGLGFLNNTAVVTFICNNCKEYSTVKKNIDSYFKVG